MVPGADANGLVAPIIVRPLLMTSLPSQTIATFRTQALCFTESVYNILVKRTGSVPSDLSLLRQNCMQSAILSHENLLSYDEFSLELLSLNYVIMYQEDISVYSIQVLCISYK